MEVRISSSRGGRVRGGHMMINPLAPLPRGVKVEQREKRCVVDFGILAYLVGIGMKVEME